MYSKSQPCLNQSVVATPYVFSEYDGQGILHIIRRYYELRSAAEMTAAQYEHINYSSSHNGGKDDILCVLADIDQGVAGLPARQMAVVRLLKLGYLIQEIGKILGISQVTVNYHIRQAGTRLAEYLNTSGRGNR